MNLPTLEIFTKEELYDQLKNNIIDIDYLIEYTIKRDQVYNLLINETNRLENLKKETILELKQVQKWLKKYPFKCYYPDLTRLIKRLENR